MQRASESISKIAVALAKAQGELENPEKSLTATIPSLANGSPPTGQCVRSPKPAPRTGWELR
jgi:hypothetical protein